MDPGELGRNDPEALRAAVATAKPFLAFRVERVLDTGDLSHGRGPGTGCRSRAAAVAEHPTPWCATSTS